MARTKASDVYDLIGQLARCDDKAQRQVAQWLDKQIQQRAQKREQVEAARPPKGEGEEG